MFWRGGSGFPKHPMIHSFTFSQIRSCNQQSAILVNSSINAIEKAREACPVTIQDKTKVSRLPVMRQVTAFNKDLQCESTCIPNAFWQLYHAHLSSSQNAHKMIYVLVLISLVLLICFLLLGCTSFFLWLLILRLEIRATSRHDQRKDWCLQP